jgi:putative ABC transport system substrate-binding protein
VLAVGLDAPQHTLRLVREIAVDAVGHQLGVAEHGIERRAQLVAHIGEELRLVLAGERELAALLLDLAEQPRVLDRHGLVTSIARPTSNVTGVSFLDAELGSKRFGILHELVPRLATILVLIDPGFAGGATEQVSVEEAARTLGRRILALKAGTDAEIEAAFATAVAAGVQGAFIGTGPFYNSRGSLIAGLMARYRLPAIYALRRSSEAGGLLSYGPNLADAWRRGGIYVARVVRGARPSDLPVELAARFELVINLRTARALGLEMPQILFATADEVIE